MILITAKVHPILIDTFRSKGFEVVYEPAITYGKLKELVPSASGLVVTTRLSIDKTVIDLAHRLKWIGRLGSGMELIDVEYAESKKIKCFSTPEGNRQAVAEHCLGMILGLRHNIFRSAIQVRNRQWIRDENRGRELSQSVVGIIGYGNTGSAFAGLLQGFGATVLAYDKFKYGFGNERIKEASLGQLCKYADIISFHVPLTSDTKHMGNRDFFDSLPNKPLIVNTSRGGVIDTGELVRALAAGKISGAALDVLENEIPSAWNTEEQRVMNALLSDDRVLITPHIAGYSDQAFYKMSRVLLDKLGYGAA